MHYLTVNGEPWCVGFYKFVVDAGLPNINTGSAGPKVLGCTTVKPESDVRALQSFYKNHPEIVFASVEGDCPEYLKDSAFEAEHNEEVADEDLEHVRHDRSELVKANAEARELLEDLVQQFAVELDDPPRLTAGGLSVLEHAFKTLGWEDPHPVPERKCEEPGCNKIATCGYATPDGYRRVCIDHAPPL